ISYLLGIKETQHCQGRVLVNLDENQFGQKINQIFYDVEAKSYDRRHPEIGEGDRNWWKNFAQKHLTPHSKPLKILDLGSGTGFVAEVLGQYLNKNDEFSCLDISPKMLKMAQEKIKEMQLKAKFNFLINNTEKLPFKAKNFDIITINSVIHHLVNPEETFAEINRVLKDKGIVVAAHEPNQGFSQFTFSRFAASLYKALGFGMNLNQKIVKAVNQQLKKDNLIKKDLTSQEILKMVEFHSPIEQTKFNIDQNKGFSPEKMFRSHFSNFQIISLEKYSTFFCRPRLQKNQLLTNLIEKIGNLFLPEGNLFNFILQKK
ncbi:MAG: methyltransferase domain-containing protein, partial [Patescibacteria group bacterium]|nr:methyltransferase domain-containing protein [Patescibacteria group bacterium]